MHIYNIKINGGKALKIIIILLSLFMLMVFLFSIYKIFFSSENSNSSCKKILIFQYFDRIKQTVLKQNNLKKFLSF